MAGCGGGLVTAAKAADVPATKTTRAMLADLMVMTYPPMSVNTRYWGSGQIMQYL